ncbi:MAG: Antibiotic biosynthesis monooxygenase [Glaciihabitans sp.]|nr:Antibiotic biosynthesis monooxygenase [Glaciihabitans sp.]
MTEPQNIPDVRKTVVVGAPVGQAFAIFAERPTEWWPDRHVFVENRQSLTIEPRVGGRYYERDVDGTEIDWGTVVEWAPPNRIVLTWRVGPGWQPIFDDERASFIEVDFESAGEAKTTVALTHSAIHRHGDIAAGIHAALDGPSPGDTLAKYLEVVTRHTAPAKPTVEGPLTLVNRFTVTGSAEEFEKVFAETSEFFAEQPGFIDHTLLRQIDGTNIYVNLAHWSDQSALRAAVSRPEFHPHSAALRALATSEPTLFSVCVAVAAAPGRSS